MIGFINLHDVESSVVIGISVESIVAIRDNRTDPYIKSKKYWQWTNIDCVNGRTYKVREEEEDIYSLIKQLNK